jgi:hypothetical protein
MKNLFTSTLICLSSFATFSQTSEDVFFEELLKEEKAIEQNTELPEVKVEREQVLFEDIRAGLALKKFTYSECESKYVFYFSNDGDVYPGKIMPIYFDSWVQVKSFFYNVNRIIEQKKHTKYTFSDQSINMSWATENIAIVYLEKQYCYVSRKHIADIITQLR